MTRGIFIAGNESALARAIEAETERRVEKFASALIPNRFSGTPVANAAKNPAAANERRVSLDWNPSSPISARTMMLAAENRLDRIDEAILVCSPPTIRTSAADLPLADVEVMVNDHVKGWFFLVKELAALFTSRKSGILALVYSDFSPLSGRDDAADILGPASLAAFRSLTQGLLAAAGNEPYITMGFSCSDAGNEEAFTSFLYKNLDEGSRRSNGKLYKFGKFNLFSKFS
jgi:NAD(P)-dependent dehydrogenase (short-subunit alcohol dehydrogenase family)